MKDKTIWNLLGWLSGSIVAAVGLINMFWGNDPGFGIFLLLLSCVYVPPLNVLFRERTGFSVPAIVKVILGVFIIWAALGVGELPDKIALMMRGM